MANPKLTLREHAGLLRHLIDLETAYRAMLPAVSKLPTSGRASKAWARLEAPIQRLKSEAENLLHAEHPDEARAAGAVHYGNPGEPGPRAAFGSKIRGPNGPLISDPRLVRFTARLRPGRPDHGGGRRRHRPRASGSRAGPPPWKT